MKVWLVEIFICHYEDEYGYVARYYRDNKVFNNEKDAKQFLKKTLKDISEHPSKYDLYGYLDNDSHIKEIEI